MSADGPTKVGDGAPGMSAAASLSVEAGGDRSAATFTCAVATRSLNCILELR